MIEINILLLILVIILAIYLGFTIGRGFRVERSKVVIIDEANGKADPIVKEAILDAKKQAHKYRLKTEKEEKKKAYDYDYDDEMFM